jgi:nitrogenase molybdenum-iron protein alpha chain
MSQQQTYEIINILNRVKPDILIARMEVWPFRSKAGIPTFYTDDEQFGFGYQGY